MNRQQRKQNPVSNGTVENEQPPVQVQAKISYAPMIATTVITTAAAVVTTLLLTRHFDKKKEEKELEREREREESAMMNPTMPMMWPGMAGQTQSAAINPQEQSKLDGLSERLQGWERGLEEREQVLGARERHLSLVMGGGGGE